MTAPHNEPEFTRGMSLIDSDEAACDRRDNNRLITIPVSHYCEKARWALELCGVPYSEVGHLPLFHAVYVRKSGGKRSVPVLKTADQLVQGSSAIASWADSFAPGTLLPHAQSARLQAIEWQRMFDHALGPATRIWAYYHCLPNRRAMINLMSRRTPPWEVMALKLAYPALAVVLRRGMNISLASKEEAARTIDEVFRKVELLLADGRHFLAGDAFSIADMAFAALCSPVLLPEEHPVMFDSAKTYPVEAMAQVHRWRRSPAGRFALNLYTSRRSARPRSDPRTTTIHYGV